MPQQDKINQIITPKLSVPQTGGTVRGVDENFNADAFTGAANFSMPVQLPAARSLTPSLIISYNSSGGNGILGIGFSLTRQSITIKTNRNIPLYNAADIFMLNGSELVASNTNPSIFLERHQAAFPHIEKCKDEIGNIFWKTISADNITSVYGNTDTARVADPGNPTHIFEWLISESTDTFGNKVLYSYNKFEGFANTYLTSIEYGNYQVENKPEKFAFKVIVDYGQISADELMNDGNLIITENPAKRLDCISSYRSGFKINTEYLVRNLFIFHNLDLPDLLTEGYSFNYDEDKIISCLKEVNVSHYQKNDAAATGYIFKSLPPVNFGFSKFNIVQTFSFQTLKKEGIEFNQPLRFADIEQEGLPGILYRNADALQYYPANGDGNFDDSLIINKIPTRYNDAKVPLQITSLEGNSMLQVEYESQTKSGYYAMNSLDNFGPFTPFENELVSDLSYRTETVDLTGDNSEDKVIITPGSIQFIQSLGLKGFCKTDYIKNTQQVEAANFETNPFVHYGFANIFGDGLNHRIKIENGKLTIWPSLGYGNFDSKIEIALDRFIINDENNAIDLRKRLILADVNGSGMADLVLINKDGINIFFNQNGTSFSEPQTIQFPAGFTYSDFDEVLFTDILGNGTNVLVLTKNEIATRHYYASLNADNDGKAFLLNTIDGNMGSRTAITYKSSVKDYLAAKQSLNPWITKLPFPTMVIDTIAASDFISNTSITNSYTYRNGYYDPYEHTFTGFGCVAHTDKPNNDSTLPVSITKQWFHLGNGTDEIKTKENFFSGDTDAPDIPFQRFDSNINLDNSDDKQDAFYALVGSLLHTEIYDETKDCPYQVSSSSYTVIKAQDAGINSRAVYRIHQCESFSVDYELIADDPLVNQSVVLEVDEYNNVLSACSLSYPRRSSNAITELPEQTTLHVLAQQSLIKNQTDINAYWLGIDLENKSYEIIGLEKIQTDNGLYYSYENLLAQIASAFNNPIPYQQTSYNAIAARLLSWQKHFYWNNDQTNEWNTAGIIPSVLLPHHQAAIVFDDTIIQNIYNGKIANAYLNDAGYYFEDNYWWSRSAVSHFNNADCYFLLNKVNYDWAETTNYKYTETTVEYDAYLLFPIKTNQYVNENFYLSTSVEIDYRVLSPWRMTDVNGNVAEVMFDVLGVVVATAHYSGDGQNGDAALKNFTYKINTNVDEIFTKPFDYIQQAGSYMYYQFASFDDDSNNWKPAMSLTLSCTVYKSSNEQDIQKSITYNDGFGRIIESKHFAGRGQMTFTDEIKDNRWLASGRVLYNAKGNPSKSYLGYFSNTWQHESEWASIAQVNLPNPTLYSYDALNRTIEVTTPKGFITKTVLPNAWEVWQYDANDTLKDSPYYKSNVWQNDANEKDAIEKAVLCYNTPAISIHDNLGRVIRSININQTLEADAKVKTLLQNTNDWCFVQGQSFDIQGRILQQADARFYDDNKTALPGKEKYNFIHFYPINGSAMKSVSTDAGITIVFNDALGNALKTWDALDAEHTYTFDHLQRPRTHHVKTSLLDNTITAMYYGDDEEAPRNANMLGREWKVFDTGGLEEMAAYTFDEHPVSIYRRFNKDYKSKADWNDDNINNPKNLLEAEKFTTVSVYDAAGRLIKQTLPDNSIQTWQYGIMGNYIRSTIDTGGLGKPKDIVTDSQLDENGLLTNLKYSNGISTQHFYDKETLQLIQVNAGKQNETNLFQQLSYWHDPTGLITSKVDNTIPTSYYNNQQVKPANNFTYDALNRLISTGGRALKGLFNNDNNSTNFSKNDLNAVENYFETYNYDKGNNLTRLSRTQTTNSFTRNYTIDNNSNRVLGYLVGTANKDLAYDNAGQMRQLAGSNTALQWNTIGQIASAIIIKRASGINDAEYYVYNALGIRIRKVTKKVGANATVTITDKRYIGNYNNQTTKTGNSVTENHHRITMAGVARHDCVIEYFSVSNETDFATSANPLYRFQHGDILNSVTVETNLNADIISYEEYSPFGETTFSWSINDLEISAKEYRYSAQEKDDNTGLYYYGYRYYDPTLCRWTKPDPAGTIDGFNLYAFVGNEPVGRADIMGLLKHDKHSQKKVNKQSDIKKVVTTAGKKSHDKIKRSHSKLNEEFKNMGNEMAKLAKSGGEFTGIKFSRNHKLDMLKKVSHENSMKKFDDDYRNAYDKMDELISTSSVREMIKGIRDAKPHEERLNELNHYINIISEIRMPTKWSGFARSADDIGPARMQHPTSPKIGGMWRLHIIEGEGNPHSEIDRQRKEKVLEAMQKTHAAGGNVKEIVRAAIVESIIFTLNEFTAPATAIDQHPVNVDEAEQKNQVLARERLKVIARGLGAEQDKKEDTEFGDSYTRPWGDRTGSRRLSFYRILPAA